MTDISTSEYFFCGSADQDALSSEIVQYGLYEPITGRIVLTSKFAQALEQVSFLFFGRYNFYIIKLSSAENFQPNMLDNLCCTVWTISNPPRMNADMRKLDKTDIIKAQKLIQVGPMDQSELVYQDIEYLMATYYWTTSQEQEIHIKWVEPFSRTETAMQSFLDMPLPLNDTARTLIEIHNIIFTEFDFAIAKPRINELLDKVRK